MINRCFTPFGVRNSKKFVPRTNTLCCLSVRLNHNDSKKSKSQNDKPKQDEVSKKEDHEMSDFKVKSTSSLASPAPMENTNIEHFMKKNKKPYIPKLKHERVSYDFPGLPNQDDFTKQARKDEKKPINRWSRYIPKILTGIVAIWAGYSIKVWVFPAEEGSDSQEVLDPNHFHKFIVTHKEPIDKDHYLIELTPKHNHWQYSFYTNYGHKSLWNGDKIWSVEIKQPQIMVVRSYTPLPLYFMKSEYTRSGERKPLLKVIPTGGNDYDKGGVLSLYVKRYDDGEVSKYIVDKEIGQELELRGPHIEYTFPYHPLKKYHERPQFNDLPSKVPPEIYLEKIKATNKLPDYDNITFYAAGTGIAPILQVLFSRNPYRGFVNVHYNARKPGELGDLGRFLFFLEKLDRAQFHFHYDNDSKSWLKVKDINKSSPSNYISPMRLETSQKLTSMTDEESLKLRKSILDGDNEINEKLIEFDQKVVHYDNALAHALVTSQQPKKPSSLSLVCGPDGYVSNIAGPLYKTTNEQGPVQGLLGKKGWNNTNTFKLSN